MLNSKTNKIQALLEHPSLWQAAQGPLHGEANSPSCVSTGFKALDHILNQGGWPLGQLIECLTPQAGCGELDLFFPAIAQKLQSISPTTHSVREKNDSTTAVLPIVLIAPPYQPCLEGWQQRLKQTPPLWWVKTASLDERLWAAEQILQSNSASVVMLWLHEHGLHEHGFHKHGAYEYGPHKNRQSKKPHSKTSSVIKTSQLRRLQLAARRSHSLVIMLRNSKTRQQPSPAPFRITLTPSAKSQQTVLTVNIVKQLGSWGGQQVNIPWHSRLQYTSPPAEQWPVYIPADQQALMPGKDKTATSTVQLQALSGSSTKWS